MKLYKTTFDYNDSANTLKQITIPTNAKYQLGVKVENDGTPLEGITLKDGADEIQPTKTDNGFAIFDLKSGDDVKADKTFGVSVEIDPMIWESGKKRLTQPAMTSIYLSVPIQSLVDIDKPLTPYMFFYSYQYSDDTSPRKFQSAPAVMSSYGDKYATKSDGTGFQKYAFYGIGAPGARTNPGWGLYGIAKVDGKLYWYAVDDAKFGQTIPSDKLLESISLKGVTLDKSFYIGYFVAGAKPYVDYWTSLETGLPPMKANFKGVVVNQEEFDVVDVPDEINELSYIDDEGEKVTIEAEDIATKEDIPEIPTGMPSYVLEEFGEDAYGIVVDADMIVDWTGEERPSPKFFNIIAENSTAYLTKVKIGDTTYSCTSTVIGGFKQAAILKRIGGMTEQEELQILFDDGFTSLVG